MKEYKIRIDIGGWSAKEIGKRVKELKNAGKKVGFVYEYPIGNEEGILASLQWSVRQ